MEIEPRKDSARRRTSRAFSSDRGRQILVGIQIALCTFLLALAGLFVRTFDRLRAVDPGFDRAHIATFMLDLMGSGITAEGEMTLRRRLLESVRAMPGVESAAISSAGVMRGHGMIATVVPEGRQPTAADYLNTYSNSVSPGYFETMGTRMLKGRNLTERDAPGLSPSAHNVVVNEAFARRYFPGVDAIGKRVVLGSYIIRSSELSAIRILFPAGTHSPYALWHRLRLRGVCSERAHENASGNDLSGSGQGAEIDRPIAEFP